MDLSKSLKVALAYNGMKNKTLAEKLGTSTQQVSNWIGSGNIKHSNIIEICKVFEMPVSEFIKLGE